MKAATANVWNKDKTTHLNKEYTHTTKKKEKKENSAISIRALKNTSHPL